MSGKITSISTPFWRGGAQENIAVADVYEGQQTETKTVSEFKSVTKNISDNVVSGVKGSKLTDLTGLIKTGSSTGIDKASLVSRLESLSGVRFGSVDGIMGEVSDGALGKLINSTGLDSKRIMDDTGQFINLSQGTDFKTANDYTSLVNSLFDTNIGRMIVDNYAEVALFGTLIAFAVEIGLPDAIDDLMDKITDKKEAKKALIASLESAARNGDVDTLKKIRKHIGGAAMFSRLPNLIPLVLQGYSFPQVYDETTNPNYKAIYDSFIDLFNSVNKDWVAQLRGTRSCSKLNAFTTASQDSLTVFTNYGEFITEALIAPSYPAKSIQDLARPQFTYTYLSS